MQDTIFTPAFGNRPSQLIGRESLLQTLLEAFKCTPGSKARATLLLGQRGSGKTALLWEIADRVKKNDIIVASPTIVSEGMLERVVEKIQDSGEHYVKGRRTYITGGSVGALGFSAGLQFTREVQETKSAQFRLTQLARKLSGQGNGLLILLDELQANSDELRKLIITYQELVGEGLDVSVIMAGLPGAVSATLNDKVLTFLNRAQKTELEPLAVADVEAYYEQAFARLGISLSLDMIGQAAAATQGSPYLMQLIGHNIVTRANEDGLISSESFERALELSQAEYKNDVCKTTLAALSETDILFLRAMVQSLKEPSDGRLSEKQGEKSEEELMASLDKPVKEASVSEIAERMGVTVDYAQKYRTRLIDSGVIQAPRRGKVSFAVPYLADYLS